MADDDDGLKARLKPKHGEQIMNKNQSKGSTKEFSGKAKEVTGKVVGDKKMESKGKAKKHAGKLQKGVGDTQEKVKRATS